MKNKQAVYERAIIEWNQETFMEHIEVILNTTNCNVHKVKIAKDKYVYVVPESIYKVGIEGLKKRNCADINN